MPPLLHYFTVFQHYYQVSVLDSGESVCDDHDCAVDPQGDQAVLDGLLCLRIE